MLETKQNGYNIIAQHQRKDAHHAHEAELSVSNRVINFDFFHNGRGIDDGLHINGR